MAGRVQNLKPFPKGVSGNPGGRPKTAHISQALRAALESGEADELASELVALARGRKRGSVVQIAALREIADRTEGKPHQSIEVDANISQKLGERLEKARMFGVKRSFSVGSSDCRPSRAAVGRCEGRKPYSFRDGSRK